MSLRSTSGFLLLTVCSTFLLFPTSHCLVRRDGHDSNCTGNASASAESVAYSQCVDNPPGYEDCPDPSLCEASSGDNVGLAFGLTIGAGFATTLGALLPFVPCIKRSSTNYLAAGLALAAGVMLYVSFTEIFDKSKYNFCCETQDHYMVAATVSFFVGIVLTVLLDMVVWGLEKLDCGSNCSRNAWKKRRAAKKEQSISIAATNLVSFSKHDGSRVLKDMRNDSNALIIPVDSSCSSTPTADSIQEGTEIVAETEEEEEGSTHPNNDIVAGSREVDSRCQTSNSDGISGISVSVVSNSMSEGTNNLTNVSVNELFSNSSLQRMNAIIPETASSSMAAESVSHISVPLPAEGEGVGGEEGGGGEKDGGVVELQRNGLLRRNSYLEMVELVSTVCISTFQEGWGGCGIPVHVAFLRSIQPAHKPPRGGGGGRQASKSPDTTFLLLPSPWWLAMVAGRVWGLFDPHFCGHLWALCYTEDTPVVVKGTY